MRLLIGTLVTAVLTSGIGSAQTGPAAIEDFEPSILNQPGQEYPQVNAEGYARFRIEAPGAESVSVSLGGGTALIQSNDGFWTGTVGPLDEGFHYYRLTVDGGTFNDPGTLNFISSWTICLPKSRSNPSSS